MTTDLEAEVQSVAEDCINALLAMNAKPWRRALPVGAVGAVKPIVSAFAERIREQTIKDATCADCGWPGLHGEAAGCSFCAAERSEKRAEAAETEVARLKIKTGYLERDLYQAREGSEGWQEVARQGVEEVRRLRARLGEES